MRLKLTVGLILLTSSITFGQNDSTRQKVNGKYRNFIWFTPSGAKEINGIAIGLTAMPIKIEKQEINGLNVEVGIFNLLAVPLALGGSFIAPFKSDTLEQEVGVFVRKNIYQKDSPIEERINGISISGLGHLGNGEINGLSINGCVFSAIKVNGLSIAGLMNLTYDFRGVKIGLLRNKTTKGKGLMIGLFNNCKDCRGVQLGLINRIGKRTYPLLNVQL
jgi:hypothetical protein